MPLSSCFSGGGDPSSSSPGTASSCTSVYSTHLGAITLTWSRSTLGLVLTADLALAVDGSAASPAPRFVLLPWLPWRRRGSKRFSFPGAGRRRHAVAFSWDLSRARLSPRRPEPLSRYSVHVSVDGELALAAGDPPSSAAGVLLSRRETAGGLEYATPVSVAGEAHEVSVGVEEPGGAMWVAVDGARALQVRRLRWKFRGSERLDDLPARGHRVRVAWDLHGWLFGAPDDAAVFVLRFDPVEFEDAEEDDDAGSLALKRQGSVSFRGSHGAVAVDGGGGSWCGGEAGERTRGWRPREGPFRSGSDSSPTVSVASTSAASSAAVSAATVAGWDAAEEAALQDGGGGFSLVVLLRKKKKKKRRRR